MPTAKDLGHGVVSSSPYGIAGPKGMEPAVVKTLHDAFRKAMDDPKHPEVLAQLNQEVWYRSGDDYAAWARETFTRDKALIERLGWLRSSERMRRRYRGGEPALSRSELGRQF